MKVSQNQKLKMMMKAKQMMATAKETGDESLKAKGQALMSKCKSC